MFAPRPPLPGCTEALGELRVERAQAGRVGKAGVREMLAEGGLGRLGEVAELLETTPGVEIE